MNDDDSEPKPILIPPSPSILILPFSGFTFILRAMNDETVSRVEKLEMHIAELERQIEQLNEVVVEQSRSIEKFKAQLRRVSETIENQERERIKDTNPKPPHYQ